MKLGKSLECERLSGKAQPRDGYISRPPSLGHFRAVWRSLPSLDTGTASGGGAGGRGQEDSVMGRSRLAEHSPATAERSSLSAHPPFLPISSRVKNTLL